MPSDEDIFVTFLPFLVQFGDLILHSSIARISGSPQQRDATDEWVDLS
jgi:hypothetical protein